MLRGCLHRWRAHHGQTGSKENVADGGQRKRTRSDEIRPIIRRWPLPPPRPKPAVSGVAGLRYGGGQRKTNHALMSETAAGETQTEEISHYIKSRQVFVLPLLHHIPGAPPTERFCPL